MARFDLPCRSSRHLVLGSQNLRMLEGTALQPNSSFYLGVKSSFLAARKNPDCRLRRGVFLASFTSCTATSLEVAWDALLFSALSSVWTLSSFACSAVSLIRGAWLDPRIEFSHSNGERLSPGRRMQSRGRKTNGLSSGKQQK